MILTLELRTKAESRWGRWTGRGCRCLSSLPLSCRPYAYKRQLKKQEATRALAVVWRAWCWCLVLGMGHRVGLLFHKKKKKLLKTPQGRGRVSFGEERATTKDSESGVVALREKLNKKPCGGPISTLRRPHSVSAQDHTQTSKITEPHGQKIAGCGGTRGISTITSTVDHREIRDR